MPTFTNVSEEVRLSTLDRYDVLDTPPEEAFDRIARLTARIFGVSMATVTFLDGHRQWFKARFGIDACETERGPAFCDLAIKLSAPLVVMDTLADSRFKLNPLVVGPPYLRFYAGAQLRMTGGTVIGTLCAMDTRPRDFSDEDVQALTDLAAIVTTELELRTLIQRDGLTGALARRAFKQEAERAFALAKRHKHPFSCLVFDLDHFKAVNDENGHAIGDLVLRTCVEVCHRELRTSDLVGRIGGEEFAIALPHVGGDAAMAVADKLRAAIEKLVIPTECGTTQVTMSVGVAAIDTTARDVDDLIKRADEALYTSKHAGRNTCSLWKPQGTDHSDHLRRVFKAGKIIFNGGHSTIDCTVRGLSERGASLDVFSAAGIPQRFTLQIAADKLSRNCAIARATSKSVQVQFS